MDETESGGRALNTIAGKRGGEVRWGLLCGVDIGTDGDPYLDRLRIIETPFLGVYLHHIHRPDVERDPHDHPWWFASLVLDGGYTELVWPDKRDGSRVACRIRRRWSLRCISLRGSHQITDVTGPLWTLVVTGPRRASWGFWRDGEFTPWREYLDGKAGTPEAGP
jgi:hypothetical protein